MKGIGFDNLPEYKVYKVVNNGESKWFIRLTAARKHYNSLSGEKSIWDEDTLIDCATNINIQDKVF